MPLSKSERTTMNKIFKRSSLFTLLCLLSFFTLPIYIKAESEQDSMIPETLYSQDLILADIIISPENYEVDPNGYHDSTEAINQAIQDCYDLGGGTVFLPNGKYRVSGNITILPFVTLIGDYNDPDATDFNGGYGTMIYADVEASESNFPALFTVGGSAGAIGLTIYYPYQTMDNVKPYPYTFEIPSFVSSRGHADHMAPTIKDVTLINAYKGIAASITTNGNLPSAANEMIHLENIKGTVLYKGFELYNSSEYGVVKEITLNNNYWASAASYINPPQKVDIDDFTKNHGLGMQIGDLEWVVFSDISIEDYHTGIRIFDGLRRLIAGQPEIYFIGQFFNLLIQNTNIALRVDNLYPNFGMTIANGYLNGSEYAIYRTDSTNSVIQMTNTDLVGKVYGNNINISGADGSFDFSLHEDAYNKELDLSNLKKKVFNAISYGVDLSGKFDSSVAIQRALNDARDNGGGIVYLPSGYYKLSDSLNIYDNTMLRGSSSVNPRDEIGLSLGTVLLADYGYTLNQTEAIDGVALITVVGDNAGVSGLRIHYPANKPNYFDGTIRLHTYTIRLLGDNNFVTHTSLAGSAYGIEVLGEVDSPVESPFIQGVNGTFYRNGVSLKYTNNAYLEELLSNGSIVSRSGLSQLFPNYYTNDWPSDANGGLSGVYDYITRPNSYFFKTNHSDNVFIKDSFTFGSNTFLEAYDSKIMIINSSGDNLFHQGYLLRLNDSILTGVNIMRYSGRTVSNTDSTLSIFNRLSLLDNTEKDIYINLEFDDEQVEQTGNASDVLPVVYEYDESKDEEMSYPITEPTEPNEEPVETTGIWPGFYYIIGVVVFVVLAGFIIIKIRGR